MQLYEKESATNVIITAVIVATIIIVLSVLILWFITRNAYTDMYYILEIFFEAPNSGGAFDLAALAPTLGIWRFAAITLIVVIDDIGRIIVISFVIAAVLDLLTYSNLENRINLIRIGRIRNHTIVCGYNNISDALMQRMKGRKIRFVVIDDNAGNIQLLNNRGALTIEGKFTEGSILKDANIYRAKAIIFTSHSDFDNLIGTIEAKKLNKDIKVLARATQEEVRNKLYRAGVDMCVLPEYLTGIELGERLAKEVKT
jgi:hypothetical protein